MVLTRRQALLGAASSALAMSSGTRARAEGADVTHLAFWGGWTGPDGLAMQRLVAQFNAEVREVQVTLTLYNWDLIFDRWLQEFVGGSPPDLVGIHVTEIAEYAHRGMLYNISREAQHYHLRAEEFPPLLWRLCQVGNGQYAIPLDFHPLGLYINARAARQAGLDPRRPPTTGRELLAWAARLTDRARGIWGLTAPAGDVECFRQWYSLLYQFGGRFMNDSGTRCMVNSAAGVQAYRFLQDMVATRRVAMPAEVAPDADFLAGRVSMYVQGPWYIRGALQAGIELVTAPLPLIGRQFHVWSNSHVLTVVNTQDSTRAAAAMRFIAWIHTHAREWAEAGQIPANTTTLAQLPSASIWPYLRPFAAEIPHIVYQPSLLQEAQLFAENGSTPLNNATRAVMLGQKTPAQAVRIMSDQVDQALSIPATA